MYISISGLSRVHISEIISNFLQITLPAYLILLQGIDFQIDMVGNLVLITVLLFHAILHTHSDVINEDLPKVVSDCVQIRLDKKK
jgi:hypothetical protein